MNLIIDENIAYAKEAFSHLGNTRLMDGRILSNEDVEDADILIVRSITNVNENLLKNSKVKFVGTATIGTDHIDLEYLKANKIDFADAKGCNADSVTEYVFTALLKMASEKNISLIGKTIGVVGVGNIGSRVSRIAELLRMKVLRNDPPVERNGIGSNYVSLDEIFGADIITFHVPLFLEGIDKTLHLLNEDNLKKIKKEAIIINTSRGPVIDNQALLKETTIKDLALALDVWEDEPLVNTELLEKTKIATSHIAGYSFEGKVNGTKMIYSALCKFLDTKPTWQPDLPEIDTKEISLPKGKTDEERLYKLLSSIYNIKRDDELMRNTTSYESDERAKYFDTLRKKYPVRREFSNYTVLLSGRDVHLKPFFENLRFNIKII